MMLIIPPLLPSLLMVTPPEPEVWVTVSPQTVCVSAASTVAGSRLIAMRFRLKIMLYMLCLLSLLFGVGGSALISISFQTSLEREKASAHEFAKGIAVIDGVFNALIRQREPALQQIHPQHFSIPFGGQPRLPLK